MSPSYGSPITKLGQMSILAESEKQHTEMFFSTFCAVELKHGVLLRTTLEITESLQRSSDMILCEQKAPSLLHALPENPNSCIYSSKIKYITYSCKFFLSRSPFYFVPSCFSKPSGRHKGFIHNYL